MVLTEENKTIGDKLEQPVTEEIKITGDVLRSKKKDTKIEEPVKKEETVVETIKETKPEGEINTTTTEIKTIKKELPEKKEEKSEKVEKKTEETEIKKVVLTEENKTIGDKIEGVEENKITGDVIKKDMKIEEPVKKEVIETIKEITPEGEEKITTTETKTIIEKLPEKKEEKLEKVEKKTEETEIKKVVLTEENKTIGDKLEQPVTEASRTRNNKVCFWKEKRSAVHK